MDEASFQAIMNGEEEGMYALDNVMLNARVGSVPASGGSGGGGKPPPPPEQFVSTAQASATLRGAPQPLGEDDGFDTSCDELEAEERASVPHNDYQDDEDNIDDLFRDSSSTSVRLAPSSRKRAYDEPSDGGGPDAKRASASARANQSSRVMDQMLSSGAAARDTSGLSCFGCVFSSRADVRDVDKHIDGDKMNSLIQIFDDNYGRIDSKVLSRLCHLYYKNEIYRPLRGRGVLVKMWRTREIFKHFTQHQLDPRVFLVEQIKSYVELSAVMRSMLVQETSGGSGVKPNHTNVALQLRVDQHLLRLRGIDPGKLNFHNPVCTIDFADKGKLMNPIRDFKKPS